MISKIKQKKQQGFTLVEVIVVAIIVAALAAVAIPLYNGYVTSSKNNMAANAAGSIASFMGACMNMKGTATGAGVSNGTVIPGGTTITCDDDVDATTDASIQIPDGINIVISSVDATPGTVTGRGGAAGETGITDQVYRY